METAADSTTVTRRILSDTQANRLLQQAADNVHRIGETSDIKIQMEQVYETVNERELFEDGREDLENGVLRMAAIDEMGFVVVHDDGSSRPPVALLRRYIALRPGIRAPGMAAARPSCACRSIRRATTGNPWPGWICGDGALQAGNESGEPA